MWPNEVSIFFIVANPLPISVRPDGMGVMCYARDFFDANVSILPSGLNTNNLPKFDHFFNLASNF